MGIDPAATGVPEETGIRAEAVTRGLGFPCTAPGLGLVVRQAARDEGPSCLLARRSGEPLGSPRSCGSRPHRVDNDAIAMALARATQLQRQGGGLSPERSDAQPSASSTGRQDQVPDALIILGHKVGQWNFTRHRARAGGDIYGEPGRT